MAVVKYIFTHKQYTELHNEVEYTNRTYIIIRIHKHNNKIHNLQTKQYHTKHTTIYKIIKNGTKRIRKNVINETAI